MTKIKNLQNLRRHSPAVRWGWQFLSCKGDTRTGGQGNGQGRTCSTCDRSWSSLAATVIWKKQALIEENAFLGVRYFLGEYSFKKHSFYKNVIFIDLPYRKSFWILQNFTFRKYLRHIVTAYVLSKQIKMVWSCNQYTKKTCHIHNALA